MIYFLCAVIILQMIIQHFERRDLYNRIMSKNMTEYKNEPAPKFVSAHQKVLERWRKKGGDDE